LTIFNTLLSSKVKGLC